MFKRWENKIANNNMVAHRVYVTGYTEYFYYKEPIAR